MNEMIKRRAWLWLALSLTLNLLLVGFVGGRLIAHSSDVTLIARPVAQDFAQRIKLLPPDEKRRFQDFMAPHRPDIKAARQEVIAARAELHDRMVADPYDATRMRDAFTKLRAKTEILQQILQDAAASAFYQLTPQSRRFLAGDDVRADSKP